MKLGLLAVFRAAFFMALVFCGGCIRMSPKMPKALSMAGPVDYDRNHFDADVAEYRATAKAAQRDPARLDDAQTQRNQIVFRVIAQIDAAYSRFEAGLATTRAGAQTAGDATTLGITAASTVIGASSVKDILSATSVALQGSRLSFDKNFFEEKTTESLISQMRASRKTLNAQMLDSLANRDVKSYPLEAAWSDLIAYYSAGTIPSALVDIASKTGAAATEADDKLKAKVKELTPATVEQANAAFDIGTVFFSLKKDIHSSDPATVSKAESTLRSILAATGAAPDSSASPDDLLDDLKAAMADANNNDAMLVTLKKAEESALANTK